MSQQNKNSNFIINKKLNLLVFVEEICNIRENPWSNVRKKRWIKESGGKLKNNEKVSASQFKKALNNFSSGYLEAQFLQFKGKELQSKLSENMGIKNLRILNKILNLFLPRFNKIWIQEKNNLENIKQNLNNELKALDKIFIDIKKISGTNTEDFDRKKIPVHLTISSHNHNDILGWFSIMGDHIDLVLEYSHQEKKKTNFLILVLVHELFHLAVRKNQDLKALIEKISNQHNKELGKFSKNMSPAMILEELLISSFVPEGFFSSYYFGSKIHTINSYRNKKGNSDLVLARRFCAYKLKNLAKEYIFEEKVIDKRYLLLLIDAIK